MINEVLLNEVPNVCQCNPSLISTLQVIVETHNYCNVPVYYTNNTSWNFVKILYPWYWSFSSTSSTFALPSGGSAIQLEKQNCFSYIGKKDIGLETKTYRTTRKSLLFFAPAILFSKFFASARGWNFAVADNDSEWVECKRSIRITYSCVVREGRTLLGSVFVIAAGLLPMTGISQIMNASGTMVGKDPLTAVARACHWQRVELCWSPDLWSLQGCFHWRK